MSKMTRYSEAKSVKVDNWGVFFLQKLQNFFNKTDHCDLTLQFNDNSQLKVHRLVLSACTDYFNHLENVCEIYDDVLIMPMDLQADVIVPIVNFMYTGTLEFQYTMYERLLKTATDMNMTVLLKLLEAHRQTSRIAKQPVLLNKQAPRPGGTRTVAPNAYQTAAQRNAPIARGNAGVKPRQPLMRHQIGPVSGTYGAGKGLQDTSTIVSKYSHTKDAKPGPSRFDDTDLSEGFEGSFDAISYESKPLLTADQVKKEEETSPFEKLRKGYTNTNVVKRSSGGSVTSPPAKKPNLDEVKEFTEAARMRSQLNTDDDDSADYVDDDTHFNDDDDEDYQPPSSVKAALAKSQAAAKQIVIKQETKSPAGGGVVKQITVKDDSGNVDHAKIISEVLKKYPHLVKKNKNIKLKIMQKTTPTAAAAGHSAAASGGPSTSKMEIRTATPLKQDMSMVRKATATLRSEQLQQKPTTSASGTGVTKPPPKTIDAKTMHALIAKGAENMTGPWLCLRCGVNGRPISIPSYKAFRNHLISKHKERIDSRICEHCGWRAEQRHPNLVYHWFTEHNIKPSIKFPVCEECGHVAMNPSTLQQHVEETHQQQDRQHCIYCNKVFEKELELYNHMKEQHRERARNDGVLDFSDDDEFQEAEEIPQAKPSDSKIKILSNITLPTINLPQSSLNAGKTPTTVQQIALEPSSEAEALSNVASGIATSLRLVGDSGVVIDDPNYQNEFIEAELASVHGEHAANIGDGSGTGSGNIITKLLSEDGTELQLTQSQREEIISQLQMNSASVVMMNADGSTLQLNDGMQIVNSTAVENQNIMLVYSSSEAGVTETAENHKTDVVASEDDASQTSAALSDKAASTGKPPGEADEGDESQESLKTDVTEKEGEGELGDDEHGLATDVEMSADTVSEMNEALQHTTTDEAMETDGDSKTADSEVNKLEDTEERHRSDKLKLISELEGDWSEDTEEPTPVSAGSASATASKTTAVVESTGKSVKKDVGSEKKVTPSVKETKKPSNQADKKKEEVSKESSVKVSDDKLSGKEIDKLLDEWNNESSKMEDSDIEADLEKKIEKATGLSPDDDAEPASKATVKAENVDDADMDSKDVKKEVEQADESEADPKVDNASTKADARTTTTADDASKTKKNGTSIKSSPEGGSKKEETCEQDVGEEEDPEAVDDDDKEKSASKSKDVSSLLGEWDEDDDL
ncbi:centrosome-associated zinc finger protein CP190 [Anopheles bellator]|uniref:centrosome-associated zinc finger protein CP190 n=1 Tax=Anopheles bellator TaxID=139047 RepID=UPI00264965A7|nr:centrosome-associated zinc finger protein CP190 [Anopheles bellator]